MLEVLEHLVGAKREDGVPTAAGDVAEGMGEEGLPYAHRSDEEDVVMMDEGDSEDEEAAGGATSQPLTLSESSSSELE